MADEKPIIIVKKTGGHAGHHGGAWKVAYADFITAMMAFFLVMWLVNSADPATKAGIAEYFQNPSMFNSVSILNGQSGILDKPFSPHNVKGQGLNYEKQAMETREDETADDIGFFKPPQGSPIEEMDNPMEEVKLIDKEAFEKVQAEQKSFGDLAKEIKEQLEKAPQLKEALGELEVQLEADGLIIEIMDTDKFSMFASGSASVIPNAKEAFLKVATLLVPFPNHIDVLGHTDAHPYSNNGGYSNWELSTDRANAARRLLLEAGITENRITGVIGRADKYPRVKKDPFAIANRRIAIKMRFGAEKTVDLNAVDDKFTKDEKAKKKKKHAKKKLKLQGKNVEDEWQEE